MSHPFANAVATAVYKDTWAGEIKAALVPFKTKRNGQTVTRYRWLDERGQTAGGFAAPFQTVEGGVRAVARHASFSAAAAVPAGWSHA